MGCVDEDDDGGAGGGGRVMLDRCPWLLLRSEPCLPWQLQQLYSLWPFCYSSGK